ncbi:MAG: triose-phosphate isomerase [Roseiflexus castenholzii]|uniref:triose-phosphate isomerase n=1 Tax=Roseiflexus castenholzii TaxID=120962 RepID=UPI000CC95671|nr:MAG: triose-phosphate isomerase [Roseiflexus castenholzii]
MRTPLLAGNWKMYKTTGEARELVEGLLHGLGDVGDRKVLVCPPFTALQTVRDLVQGTPIALGAQDVYIEPQGAFTGAISPVMLRDLGCAYVIVGHSERRAIFSEGDELIGKKVCAALAHDLTPILCVGETKPQRDAGQAETVVITQVRAALTGMTPEQIGRIVIAYEPVWAIGTGDTATPVDAQAMHETIRRILGDMAGSDTAATINILYGGSVKPDNIDDLMAQPDIDGALVGGASLKADSFLRIVHFLSPQE